MKNKAITALIITLSVIVISIVFFTKTPEYFISRLPFINSIYENTSLVITSKNSSNNVFIDGKEYGATPLEIEDLEEGQHEILLSRISNDTDSQFYESTSLYIELQRNTEALVDLEIGPSKTLSGFALYYTPAPDGNENSGLLTASSNPVETKIQIDNENTLEGPIDVLELESGEYNLTISSKGYESIEIPVIIRDGFNLNLHVELLPIPVNL